MRRQMQEYHTVGVRPAEMGLLLQCHRIMDRYPAYTVRAILDEDPLIVEGLLAQITTEAKLRKDAEDREEAWARRRG